MRVEAPPPSEGNSDLQLVGSTDPSVAYPGTIRGDWAMSIER